MRTTELDKLSAIQKAAEDSVDGALPQTGGYLFGVRDPGCFAVTGMMKEIVDRRERATRRAAAGRALARLIGRGLLASCSRGSWRLTPRRVQGGSGSLA